MLSKTIVDRAKPKGKQYKLYDTDGLHLLISPKGTKSFYFRYAWHDKRLEIKIGKYPLTSLTGARKKRDDYLLMIENGKNPKHRLSHSKLFKDIALDWLQTQDYLSDRTVKTTTQRLSRCIDEFGHVPISEIDSIQVLTFLQKIENRGYIETAKRTKSIISRVYEYANILNLTNINPTTGLSRILKNKKSKNFPFVKKVEDIRHLMFDINHYHGMVEVQLALKIASYTFVRPGELRFARWHELEGDIWRIPAERTKLRREHLVPLSIQVKALFKELKALNHEKKYIFSSYSKDRPISDNTLTIALKRMGYKGKQTVHGFRHLASTQLNEQGYDADAIELQLAHKIQGIRGVYNKAEKLEYRTKMMQKWADWIDALE